MMIQPIKSLYGQEGNRYTANKLRILKIKGNVENTSFIDSKFDELSECFSLGKLDKAMSIIVDELFYEVVSEKYICRIYDAYKGSSDKGHFMSNLKESYKLRGVKSIVCTWSPIISR